jgi:hypothetical protein
VTVARDVSFCVLNVVVVEWLVPYNVPNVVEVLNDVVYEVVKLVSNVVRNELVVPVSRLVV